MRGLTAGVLVWAAAAVALADDTYWPHWRGPEASGSVSAAQPPVEWSEEKNIRWKVELPGMGQATPIVWKDRVFIQTAVDTGKTAEGGEPPAPEEGRRRGRSRTPTTVYQFMLIAFDRASGKEVWRKTLAEAVPHEGVHPDSSHASTSPTTDGKHIYAWFGSRGLFCVDWDGNVKWEKQFGKMYTRNSFGEGGAPVLFEDLVIVNWDHEGDDDFTVALDKKSGDEKWRVDRDEATSWSSPVLVQGKSGPQIVTSAAKRVRSYDAKTGKLIWECSGMTNNVIPTPVFDDQLLFAISGFRGNALLAIKYGDASGDITGGDNIAWEYEGRGTPYVPSPVLYDGKLYFLDNTRAILSCFDGQSGEKHYDKQRLGEMQGVYASPVAAAGRVYIAGRDGQVAVIKHGPEYELLSMNALDDRFDASPALVGKELFLRGRKHLYCIAE